MAQFRRNHTAAGNTGLALVRMVLILGVLVALIALGLYMFGPRAGQGGEIAYAGPDAWFLPTGGEGKVEEGNGFTICFDGEGPLINWVAFLFTEDKLAAGWGEPPIWESALWTELVDLTWQWARRAGRLYVVVGPVYRTTESRSERSVHTLPDALFRVILDLSGPESKGIGFVVPFSRSTETIHAFALPIDSVEALSGFDFFPDLMTPTLESATEGSMDTTLWPTDPTLFRERNHPIESFK